MESPDAPLNVTRRKILAIDKREMNGSYFPSFITTLKECTNAGRISGGPSAN